jgi:hypothetical protein
MIISMNIKLRAGIWTSAEGSPLPLTYTLHCPSNNNWNYKSVLFWVEVDPRNRAHYKDDYKTYSVSNNIGSRYLVHNNFIGY